MERTVLLVSANRTLVMFMGVLVKRMGFRLASASSGPEALGMIGIARPGAVVIDADIAVFDGLDTLDRLKEGGPAVPPVVMLVGAVSEEAERRCLTAGATSILTKPVKAEELHHALQECIFLVSGLTRKFVRTKADVRVTVYHDGKELGLCTESISAGGLFVRHDEPLPVGAVLDLHLPLGDRECLILSGKVIYNQKPCPNASGICPGFAVKFINPKTEDVEAIREFVSSYMTEDIIGIQPVDGEAHDLEEPMHGQPGNLVYAAMHSYSRETGNSGKLDA